MKEERKRKQEKAKYLGLRQELRASARHFVPSCPTAKRVYPCYRQKFNCTIAS
jgi:hypothetical protein